MKRWWHWVTFCLVLLASPALAETVHLTTGESIKGRIVRADQETISIESDKGFGVLQISRADITLIEFDESERDLSRLVGIGYYHRATPSSVGAEATEYGLDALSLKMWLSRTDSVDLLVGFYNAEVASGTLFEVFSVDLRYASVFSRRGTLDLYWGGSVGYLNVTDKTSGRNVEDTGTSFRGFLGVELFFLTLPNLGISSEIGIGYQTVGDSSTTTTFPAFSIRYYF